MLENRPPLPPQLRVENETVFVGRRHERRELASHWEDVVSGRRRTVFIGGEPGAGKTRLASELATACYEDGAVVLAGSSTRDFGYPLQPFVEMLDRLFLEPAAVEIVDDLDTDTVANLALLSPQLAHSVNVEPASPTAFDDPSPLLHAATEITRVLTDSQPVVMVLDNLHWAGPQTRQLLRALVATTHDRRLFIVATHRTTAPDRSRELTRSIADLYGMTGVSRIDLAGLDSEEIAEFLTASGRLTGFEARRAAVILRDHTGGNPFFLEETWRDLDRREDLQALIADNLPTPRTVSDVLELRLAALAPGTLGLLGPAAIAGDDIDLDLLYDIGFEPATALAAVDDAIEHGLLQETGSGISFRHALTRQSVIDRIPRHDRLRIHVDVALALEQRGRRTPDAIAAIAHHYEQAAPLGYNDKAIEYLKLSAQASRRSLAHREAAASFEHAAALVQGQQAIELRLEAAESHCRGWDLEAAQDLYRELANVTDPRQRARAAIGLEEASWTDAVDPDLSSRLLADAVSVLPATDPLHTRALASLGRALLMTDAVQQATDILDSALVQAREIGDRELLAHALAMAISAFAPPDRLQVQYDRTLELLELADVAPHFHVGLAYGMGANSGYRLGIPNAFEDRVILAQHYGPSVAQPTVTLAGRWLEAAASYLGGRLDEARRQAHAWMREAEPFGSTKASGPFGMQMFFIERASGKLRALPEEIITAAIGEGGWKPGALAVYTELGDREKVVALLPSVMRSCDKISPVSTQWAALAVFATEATAMVGNTATARHLRELLAPFEGQNLLAGYVLVPLGSTDRYLALLDHVLGDMESATAHFEKALEMDRRMHAAIHEAETLLSFAAHLTATGEHERARELGAQGREIANRIGLKRRIPLEKTTRPVAATGSDLGLSPRELDVLRLLAEGLSNREIGDTLMISTNTAANHVRSILMKTGATNRTQAAVQAANAGLL